MNVSTMSSGSAPPGMPYERELVLALHAARRGDSEALHDFRVALRRLRVLVKALAPPGKRRKRVQRCMSSIQARTSRGRDAQVMLDWLAKQWPRLDEQQRIGAAKWRRILERDFKHEQQRLKREAASLRALTVSLASLPLKEGPPEYQVAERLEALLVSLRSAMSGGRATAQLHPLRLTVKRARYLLLPFCHRMPACSRAEAELHKWQDTLGEWHDALLRQQSLTVALRRELHRLGKMRMKMAGKSPPCELVPTLPGMLALARSTTAARQRLEREITRDCLPHASPLIQLLEETVTELRTGRSGWYHPDSVQ